MSLTRRHCPIIAAKHASLWARISVAEPITLYKAAQIQTTTTPEGIVHPFGAYIKAFGVVCNVLHTVMLAIPARTPPRSTIQLSRAASFACLDRRLGVWCRKDVNASLERPSTIIQGHIQRILRGWGCLSFPDRRHCPIMAAKHNSFWAKIAIADPIILYKTAKIRTNTTPEKALSIHLGHI